MATIPGILLFGGTDLQGGSGGVPAIVSVADVLAGKAATQLFDRDLLRIIPDDSEGEPAAATLSWWPWMDFNLGDLLTVDSATATTVTVSPDPGWTTNEHAGAKVSTSSANLGLDNQAVAVISNTSDTLTVASWTLTPVVAGSLWLNEGRFSDYAALVGYRSPDEILAVSATRGGGSAITAGVGVGYDAGLLAYLWEDVFSSSPYFVCAKYSNTHDASDFASAGSPRTTAESYVAAAEAAFALKYPSDTLEWRYIFVNHVHQDVDAWIAELPAFTQLLSYQSDLEAEITWLRGATMANNANARILLPNHKTTLREADATAAGSAINMMGTSHAGHALVAADDSLVRTVDFNGQNPPTISAELAYSPDEDQIAYAASFYWREGAKMISKSIELWENGDGTATDGVMPVYIIFGDSIETGEITTAYSTALDSDVYTATPRDTRQRIWNRTNQTVETYDAHTNTQTSGQSTTNVGAHFSLTHKLMLRHPDTGFVLIQRGSGGSSLAEEVQAYASGSYGTWLSSVSGENWEEFNDDVTNCYAAINTQFGKQAQLRAIYVGLGTNDAFTAGGGTSFVNALDNFVAEMRDKWGHVVEGKETPVIWRMPQLGTANRIYDELITIRAALTAKAKADPQFTAHNVDDLERKADNLHETAASNVTRGERIDDEIAKIELPNCTRD